jgi:transposase InsO family protein
MHSLHPQARTTPAVRQEIARSTEPTGVLAQRFSVSTETVRKWRKRGAQDCQDHSSRPHKLPWKATDEERAIVCALRQATGFPLDDLTFIVTHFLPHLNRDAVYRILKAEGLGRLPPAQRRKPKSGTFKDYDLGFVHIDIKHLPKLETANGERRKRYLYVAIDRCSRWVHLAVKDDELATSAVAFLKEAVRAFPFKITHVLTDRGSCFTADAFEDACRQLKLEHRKTKPYTPQTNGLVERFNGRVQREVLGITIYSHRDLETLLKGFNQAYNRRRQRVLKGRTPDEVVRSRLAAEPKLANRRYKPPDADALPLALQVVAAAKEVSHPDNLTRSLRWCACGAAGLLPGSLCSHQFRRHLRQCRRASRPLPHLSLGRLRSEPLRRCRRSSRRPGW